MNTSKSKSLHRTHAICWTYSMTIDAKGLDQQDNTAVSHAKGLFSLCNCESCKSEAQSMFYLHFPHIVSVESLVSSQMMPHITLEQVANDNMRACIPRCAVPQSHTEDIELSPLWKPHAAVALCVGLACSDHIRHSHAMLFCTVGTSSCCIPNTTAWNVVLQDLAQPQLSWNMQHEDSKPGCLVGSVLWQPAVQSAQLSASNHPVSFSLGEIQRSVMSQLHPRSHAHEDVHP